MPVTLTNTDLINAARQLGCELATIRAVDEVESNGRGFTKSGDIVIRFETHIFKRYTGLTVSGSDRAAFNRAYALNKNGALLSCSWGRYQIMGFNYAICGYESVTAFVNGMKTGEPAQLAAFVAFVKGNGIADVLARRDWAGFAYRYNGANYAAGGYHTKLRAAYEKFSKQSVPASSSPADPELIRPTRLDGNTILALLTLGLLGAAAYYAFDGRWQNVWTYTKLRTKQLLA